MYCKLFSHVELEETRSLKTYTQDGIPLLGKITVSVKYGSQEARLPLTVCKGPWPALFGRDWMRSIRLDWRSIFERAQVQTRSSQGENVHALNLSRWSAGGRKN